MIPLVFVHGFMGGSAQWDGQVAALAGVPVIALDLPGYGKNAHLEACRDIVDFAHWALDELERRNVTRFHLLGHSMGGMIAQEMAAFATRSDCATGLIWDRRPRRFAGAFRDD